MKLAIVIPAYNEETVIGSVISGLPRELSGISDIKVLVIDDGSKDLTSDLARAAGAKVLRHLINRGQGAAVQTGIEAAKKLGCDFVVTIDGDGQHHGRDVADLLQPLLRDEADVVNGSRFMKRQSIPWLRRIYNFFANFVTWVMSGYFLTDSQSGMKAFGPQAIRAINITANRYEFCTEIIREASAFKLRIKEIPVDVSYTKYSMKKGQNFAVGLNTIFKLIIRSVMK